MDKKTKRRYAKDLCDMADALFKYYQRLFPSNEHFHVDVFKGSDHNKVLIYNDYLEQKGEPIAYLLDGEEMKDLHDFQEPVEMWGKCHECGYEFEEKDGKEVRYTAFGHYQGTEIHCPRCGSKVEDWEFPTLEVVNGN